MSKMIQIRNVPEPIHRELKTRAAATGMTLSDYLLREVKEYATRPTLREMMDRLAKLPPVQLDEEPVDVIRRMRDSR